MFSPEVVFASKVTTSVATKHALRLTKARARDLVLLSFSEPVRLRSGWRWHGQYAWRIMRQKDAYVRFTTPKRTSLIVTIKVIKARTFDDQRPFLPARRILKTKPRDRTFADTQVSNAEEVRIRAPEYGSAIVLKMTDHTHPDAEKDRTGAYKVGYPVNVSPLNHIFGIRENKREWIAAGNDPAEFPGRLAVVRLPAIDHNRLRTFALHQSEDDAGDPAAHPGNVYRVRRWWIDRDRMSAWFRNELATKGEATISYSELRSYMRRIRDRAQYRDAD